MNDYGFLKQRKRHQSLFIVEGNHEKYELVYFLIRIFPELDIREEDVVIYGTNIYILYEKLVREYSDLWDTVDVDIPYLISKDRRETPYNKMDFVNIILMFDYERHDPGFAEEKIVKLQRYFSDVTDVGKLYINYPMVESYQHFFCWPDQKYNHLSVPVTLQPGKKYKNVVKDTFVAKLMQLPNKLDEILMERFGVLNQNLRTECVHSCLENFFSDDIGMEIERILEPIISNESRKTAIYQIRNILMQFEFLEKRKTYWDYMTDLFKDIIRQSIRKAVELSVCADGSSLKEIKKMYYEINLEELLEIQNEVSRNMVDGFIWVLNTGIFLVPDYNVKLIE